MKQVSDIAAVRRRLECRQWIRMIAENGRTWWAEMKQDIAKKRGQDGLKQLIADMEQERERMRYERDH